jgi:hypothetical protein
MQNDENTNKHQNVRGKVNTTTFATRVGHEGIKNFGEHNRINPLSPIFPTRLNDIG